MTEVNVTWNSHKAKVIEMVNDEGKFSLPGTSVLLKRGNWGLLCNWIDTSSVGGKGCFEVLPVEILPDGTIKKIAENNPDWRGGIDIWSQGLGIFCWRDGYEHARATSKEEFAKMDVTVWGANARRPKLLVFIPPKGVDTSADDSTTKDIKENPKVW